MWRIDLPVVHFCSFSVVNQGVLTHQPWRSSARELVAFAQRDGGCSFADAPRMPRPETVRARRDGQMKTIPQTGGHRYVLRVEAMEAKATKG